MLRVTGGEFRGQKLFTPKDLSVRPALDMVRVALFNILADRVPGAKVLDLFAGTGAFGIESLSRGAEFALFVEREKKNCVLIQRNLQKLALLSRAAVLALDVFDILAQKNLHGAPFDIIFIDPPYALTENEETCAKLRKILHEILYSEMTVKDATLIFREPKESALAAETFGDSIDITRTYGKTRVTLVSRT